MKGGDSMPSAGWAVLALALWQSRELLNAWRHSPYDRLGWLALAVWLAPIVWLRFRGPIEGTGRPYLLGGALAAIAIGGVTGMNAPCYAGLALAIAAIPGASLPVALWLVASVSWMPALSWAGNSLPAKVLLAVRIAIALTGAAVLVRGSRPSAPSS